MPHRPAETRALFGRVPSYPAERAAVIEAVGDAVIRSPHGSEVHLRSVLAASETARFETADHPYNTVMATLGGEHVGRRRYDDRGANPARVRAVAL